jgi:hypothetical protein
MEDGNREMVHACDYPSELESERERPGRRDVSACCGAWGLLTPITSCRDHAGIWTALTFSSERGVISTCPRPLVSRAEDKTIHRSKRGQNEICSAMFPQSNSTVSWYGVTPHNLIFRYSFKLPFWERIHIKGFPVGPDVLSRENLVMRSWWWPIGPYHYWLLDASGCSMLLTFQGSFLSGLILVDDAQVQDEGFYVVFLGCRQE